MFKPLRQILNKLRITFYEILFIDQDTRRPSPSKFWSNVASAALIYAFLNMYTQGVDYWWAIGGLLLGNNLGHRYMNTKTGVSIESGDKSK